MKEAPPYEHKAPQYPRVEVSRHSSSDAQLASEAECSMESPQKMETAIEETCLRNRRYSAPLRQQLPTLPACNLGSLPPLPAMRHEIAAPDFRHLSAPSTISKQAKPCLRAQNRSVGPQTPRRSHRAFTISAKITASKSVPRRRQMEPRSKYGNRSRQERQKTRQPRGSRYGFKGEVDAPLQGNLD